MNFKTRLWENIFIFIVLFVVGLLTFYQSSSVFFAQDDFILISQFSHNSLWEDFKQVFAYPNVSHWRPLHNLYFLISGNLFGKFYPAYHFLTLVVHIVSAFMIFKILRVLTKNANVSLLGAIVYTVHPSHFVSFFWISGSATSIGFLFLISSFYFYLQRKKSWALVLFVLSLFASEAMIAGVIIFIFYEFILNRKIADKRFLTKLIAISLGFFLIRFLFLTSEASFKTYPLEVSKSTIDAFIYYFLRTLGFAEISNDKITSIILIFWLVPIAVITLKIFRSGYQKVILFIMISAIIGLFPFILIPSHLSPHYMNISIWAFASAVSFVFLSQKATLRLIFILIFVLVSIINIQLTYQNNWVVKRSEIAKQYIQKIESENPSAGTLLTFDESPISTSSEAYFALGTGKAIDFWFRDKNYKTCFSAFENCQVKN